MKCYDVAIVMQRTYSTYVHANNEQEALECALDDYWANGGDSEADLEWSDVTCCGEDEEEAEENED